MLSARLLLVRTRRCKFTHGMADDSVLDEIQDNTKKAGQRLRASLNLMRSQGMSDDGNYRELVTRLSTALAMTEAAYLEARRRRVIDPCSGFSLYRSCPVEPSLVTREGWG